MIRESQSMPQSILLPKKPKKVCMCLPDQSFAKHTCFKGCHRSVARAATGPQEEIMVEGEMLMVQNGAGSLRELSVQFRILCDL